MGIPKEIVYTKDDAEMIANELLIRLQNKEDMSEEQANQLAWRLRWVMEKYDLA